MDPRAALSQLGEEDLVLLRLLADGRTIPDIARRMRFSDRTVRRRSRMLCDQLGVGTTIEAVVLAARHHLI